MSVDGATVAAVVGAGAAGTAVVAGCWKAGRVAVGLIRGLLNIVDDWRGEPARVGVPRRAGVMERLANLETKVGTVAADLRPDGGSSLRDAVDRVEGHLGTTPGGGQS